jgi:hypothetical protein
VLGVLVDLPFITHRSVCLPVLARLWRPKRTGTRLELGIELVAALADRYPDRAIHLVADSAYAGKTLGQLPAHVTVTVRMRADAALSPRIVPLAPWYVTKHAPSIADMLAKLRRALIAAQYRPRHIDQPT